MHSPCRVIIKTTLRSITGPLNLHSSQLVHTNHGCNDGKGTYSRTKGMSSFLRFCPFLFSSGESSSLGRLAAAEDFLLSGLTLGEEALRLTCKKVNTQLCLPYTRNVYYLSRKAGVVFVRLYQLDAQDLNFPFHCGYCSVCVQHTNISLKQETTHKQLTNN